MLRYPLRLTVITLGLAVGHAHASHATADLMEVYQQAVMRDARVSATRHAVSARQERVPQARAGLLPEVSIGGSTETSQASNGLSRRSGTLVQATLTQPLFRLDRWYSLKAAQADSEAAQLELVAREQELVLEAAQAYFGILRAEDALHAAKAEEWAFDNLRQQAQARLRRGAASLTDLLDTQAAHDQALASRLQMEGKVRDAYEALTRLTGQYYASAVGIAHDLPLLPPDPAQPDRWVRQMLTDNPMLQASAQILSAAEQSKRQRLAGHAPSLDLKAGVRRGDPERFGYTNGSGGDIAQRSISLEFSMPIYSGGLTRSQTREAYAVLAQREDEHEDRRRALVQTTRNLYRAVTLGVIQAQAHRQSIRSSRASLRANQTGRSLGSRNTADVLQAQRHLYSAIRDYNEARYDHILNTLRLKQVVGRLSSHDLTELSRYLRYEAEPRSPVEGG